MNEIQKTELNILKEFIRVCKEIGAPYFLVCGSCLGAVKYGGFIPWDDDIDVGMRREDYELFLEKAPRLLPEYLFLQNYKSDRAIPFLYSKLRDSRTTMIEKSTAKLPINHGIYIDIFPLDGYPEKHLKRYELKKRIYKLQLLCAFDCDVRPHTRVFIAAERLLGFHKRCDRINRKLETLLRSCPTESSALWCNQGNWQGKREYAPREQYGRGTEAVFEGLKVCVPEKYDAYLTQKYGDWRADLPDEQKKSHHGVLICDAGVPYTRRLSKESPE